MATSWTPMTRSLREEYRRIVEAGDLSEDDLRRGWYLADIYVDPADRNNGQGTRRLREDLKLADANGCCTFLRAIPYEIKDHLIFSEEQKRLTEWYERLGYRHIGGGRMYRLPPLRTQTLQRHAC